MVFRERVSNIVSECCLSVFRKRLPTVRKIPIIKRGATSGCVTTNCRNAARQSQQPSRVANFTSRDAFSRSGDGKPSDVPRNVTESGITGDRG